MPKSVRLVLGFYLPWENPAWRTALTEQLPVSPGPPTATAQPGAGDDPWSAAKALVPAAATIGAPFLLAASNAAWHRLREDHPDTLGSLRTAAEAGQVRVVLTHGNGAALGFLDDEEWQDELVTNREFVVGLFGDAESRDVLAQDLCLRVGAERVLEHLGPRYTWAPGVALEGPRLLGDTIVLPALTGPLEELGFLAGCVVRGELPANEAVDGYVDALCRAFGLAEEGAVLTLWHTLAGPESAALLQIAVESYNKIAQGEQFKVVFGTPESAGRVEERWRWPDSQAVGWYPLRLPIVRSDGYYAPADVETPGPERYWPRNVLRRHPFVIWDGGLYLARLLDFIFAAFGIGKVNETGHAWAAATDGAELRSNAAFLLRAIKAAHRWGVKPAFAEQAETGAATLHVAALLRSALQRGVKPAVGVRLADGIVDGLRSALGFQLDTRLNGVERFMRERPGRQPSARVLACLREAREHRLRAAEGVNRLDEAVTALGANPGSWYRVVDMLETYGRELMLATRAIDIVWGEVEVEREAVENHWAMVIPPQLAVLLDRYPVSDVAEGAGALRASGSKGESGGLHSS